MLSSHGYEVECFNCPATFLSKEKPNVPSCLILDFNLSETHGNSVQKQLTGNGELPVIFLSGFADVPTTVRAMRQGASEFLLKPVDGKQLLTAVRMALKQASEHWYERQALRLIQANYESLTRCQREVLPYIVRGFLNKQTAHELGKSEITIRIHRGQIMRKMSASSLAELVLLASRLGIPECWLNLQRLMSA